MPNLAELLAQAKVLHGAGHLQQAEQLYRQVIASDADNVDAHYLLGAACLSLRRLDEAAASLRRALELSPNHADAHHHLGVTLAHRGCLDEAILSLQNATRLNPHSAEMSKNLRDLLMIRDTRLAIALIGQGKLEEAATCYRRVLELNPDVADTHNNLGTVFRKLGRHDEAVDCFRRALALNPDLVEANYNLGCHLADRDQPIEAVACFRRALAINPGYGPAHDRLGLVLQRQGRFDEAAVCHWRAIELMPDGAEGYNNLGTALAQQSKLEEAVESWRRAVELRPDHAAAHQNRAIALLLLGRFDQGWSEYEWRFGLKGRQEPSLPQPRWTGTPLGGQAILLRSEQGLGDTLQFVRYARLINERGGRVLLECQPPLIRLMASCAGVDQVIAKGNPLPDFDVHVPLLSLPLCFGTTLESIPATVPYLEPDATLVEQWRAELGEPEGLKIGIAWHGSTSNPFNRARSFPLAEFARIGRLDGVRLYSLQMGAGREQLASFSEGNPVIDLGDRLGDFENTAAILRNLDLVITCDSAPAHLAGALGVKVWVALAAVPDWRWMLERGDSPWYPTMRLFRQPRLGDWAGAFEAMEEELKRSG